MKHQWEYTSEPATDDAFHRKCNNCLIEEIWDSDCEKWTWLATDEFMNCSKACEDEECKTT